jgi:hypothetical protein
MGSSDSFSATLMEPAQFHQLRKALGTFYWDNGFDTFCHVTGFDPQFQHAQEKWQQFSACIQAMGQLDDRTWETLLEASLAAQQTEPLLHR